MDGNKTRFMQLQTAPNTRRGQMVAQQVFLDTAVFRFAANSPSRKIQRNGRGKTMKRLFATTLTRTSPLCAATVLHAQTTTPIQTDARRGPRLTRHGTATLPAQTAR